MVKNPSLMPGFRSFVSGDIGQRRRDVAEYIQGCWRSCYEAGDGMNPLVTEGRLFAHSGNDAGSKYTTRPFVADCIIANPPSLAHVQCAEKLGIPLHIMFTMPYSPTQAFPHPLANVQSSNADPHLTNYMSYAMIEVLLWQGLGDIINRFRAKCLGLDPVSLVWAPGMLHRLKVPHTYCWSPALIPKPKDWASHISISGFYLLKSASEYIPTPELKAFLDAGSTPVYVGFGSIVLDDPDAMTKLIFEAARKTGQRVLLSQGWGGIGADLRVPGSVFLLGDVPHDWLFQHVSCVVHHGGAGTTAAGITAGRPTLVVPFFGDQPWWGAMIARAGAGPEPIPYKQLTADKLADAISFCLRPGSLDRAKELASKIVVERGSDMGAQSFHQYLEPDRLRCTLAPCRAAAWRIKRTKVRLSAFAACTLANADLLDFHDLKFFRPQEYQTDEGPWDPVSGFGMGVFGALSSMAMGLADLPSETLKALHIPTGSSRQQCHTAVPTNARKSATLCVSEEPTPPNWSEQNLTRLKVQDTLDRARNPSNISVLSCPTSNSKANTMLDDLQGPSSSKQSDSSRSRTRGRRDSSLGKDRDMLRLNHVSSSKGLPRIIKAGLQAPMDLSMGITKGFHNAPKLWGDETVRPQEQVSNLKSGVVAIGKEFGFGMYDGVTGLVTQPWKGARKDGASGFLKGIGKGMGGFVIKPGAALFGIPSYLMKGVHKEVQNLFGCSVQNYIIASRTAQGYEEWLQSSDAEKQDVIDRWKLIQKYLKKRKPEEMMRDILETQRKMSMGGREVRQDREQTAQSVRSADTDASSIDVESTLLIMSGSQSSEVSVDTAEVDESTRLSFQDISNGDPEEHFNMERPVQKKASKLQRRKQKPVNREADGDVLRQAMPASEDEAQRHAKGASAHGEQMQRALTQNLKEQSRQVSNSSRWATSDLHGDYPEFVETARTSQNIAELSAAANGESSSVQQPPSYDPGHLAGTTQSGFEVQQEGQRGEKTMQERTEEEIVMNYVKKQSLLEAQHRSKGKGRAAALEDEDDEDLQKVLKASMQGHEHSAEHQHGEALGRRLEFTA